MPFVAAVPSGSLAARLIFGLIALAVDLLVAWRLLQASSDRFRYRGWSKAGWLVAVFGITWHLGAIALPVGAVLARSRIWNPPPPPDPGSIPFAEGHGWPEGWS